MEEIRFDDYIRSDCGNNKKYGNAKYKQSDYKLGYYPKQPINEPVVTFAESNLRMHNNETFQSNKQCNFDAITLAKLNNINNSVNNSKNSIISNERNSDNFNTKETMQKKMQRSTLSLCSCDADTAIIPDPLRPIYQYSLERKRPTHTYTCEQNAQILLRLEKERKIKYNSWTNLQPNQTINQCGYDISRVSSTYDATKNVENDIPVVDFIPPPPPPMQRRHSSKRHPHQHKDYSLLTECLETTVNFKNKNIGNCNLTNLETVYSKSKKNQPNNNHISMDCLKPNTNDQNIFSKKFNLDIRTKHDQLDTKFNVNVSSSPKYEYYFDENHIHKISNNLRDKSFFFYLEEFPEFVPNNNSQFTKYNTVGPSNYHYKVPMNHKYHGSSCNLSQLSTSSLLKDRFCTNSSTNFTTPNPSKHFNLSSSFMQTGDMIENNGTKVLGKKMLNDSYNSISSVVMPHNLEQGPPNGIRWKHRTCPSRNSNSSSTSSTRWDMPSRHWLAVTSILLIAGAAGVAVPLALRVTAGAPLEERLLVATQLLDSVPLIDGHNDLPWNIRKFLHNQLNDFHFDDDLKNVLPWSKSPWSHTDLVRLRKGRVAAQFWAAYVPCEAQHRDAVQLTLEQIDVIKRLTDRYSPFLITCTSSTDILNAHKNRQLCSLTGVEGGHSLGGSLGVLRTLYMIGVRYVTLTSTCHTPWADSSHADAPRFDIKHGGLTSFGKTIIKEMNRLGMIVDLSHVSIGTMRDALSVSEAPVIFSHSSAYELCNSSRNVQNDILELVSINRGLVMVNFYSRFLSCSDNATVFDAVAHINHIKEIAGIDHIGLGAGFDGINYTPKGLEDVSSYPMLFAELLGNGWSLEDLAKLAGQNFLRVMEEVEHVRDMKKKSGVKPYEDIPSFRADDTYNCTTS